MLTLKKVHDPYFIAYYKKDNGERYEVNAEGKKVWKNDHRKFDIILGISMFIISLFFLLCPQFGAVPEISAMFFPDIGGIMSAVHHPSYIAYLTNWIVLIISALFKCRTMVYATETFAMAYLFLPWPI